MKCDFEVPHQWRSHFFYTLAHIDPEQPADSRWYTANQCLGSIRNCKAASSVEIV